MLEEGNDNVQPCRNDVEPVDGRHRQLLTRNVGEQACVQPVKDVTHAFVASGEWRISSLWATHGRCDRVRTNEKLEVANLYNDHQTHNVLAAYHGNSWRSTAIFRPYG